MKHKIINIEGMTCSACSNGLEKYLNKQKGIEATVNLVMATASIFYDESIVSEKDLDRFIKEAGFCSLGDYKKEKSLRWTRFLLFFFGFLAIFLMYLGMGHMFHFPIPSFLDKMVYPKVYLTILLLASLLALIWGFDIIRNGVKNIWHRMPNMDSLVGIGVIVNFLYSLYHAYFIYLGSGDFQKIYFDSVIMIILFVKIGRYIDQRNKTKAVDAIKNLVTITPKEATLLRDNKEVQVTLNEIVKGDIVVCKPGEKIAVDGVITQGETHTDESFLTGESKPVHKEIGDFCLAGSINYDGFILYEAVHIGKDSSVSHIVDMVVQATNTKARFARIADKISLYFVPFIFGVALLSCSLHYFLTGVVSESIESLVTVLVVACPCALGLATPLAMVVAIGSASRSGFVIKSSEVLEKMQHIDTIVFDKTGTLTKGELEIVDQYIVPKYQSQDVMKLLGSLEVNSNHPIAKSISRTLNDFYPVLEFREVSGLGVTGKINHQTYYAGNRTFLETTKIKNTLKSEEVKYAQKGESIVYFWNDSEVIAIFGLRDDVKPHVHEAISGLKQIHKKIVMLSGDQEFTAQIIAKDLGISEVYSNILPEGKLEKIKELNLHHNVLMVGDGINDAPALKAATIGVSVSNGTDISNDASDVIMLSDDLRRLFDLFQLSKKTVKIMKENLFWALFYNLCMVPLATGFFFIQLNPMIASIAMVFSSLTVVMNSLRLRKY